MSLQILIAVDYKRWKKVIDNVLPLTEFVLEIVAKNVPQFNGEVSVLLTNDAQIQKLNREYRNKNKPTNVLSFPQNEPGLLGDIALSLDTLEYEAKESDKSLPNHFMHLLIHGALHLIGHDHQTDAEQIEMEDLEIKLLTKLGIENPY